MTYRYFNGETFDRDAFAADLEPLLRAIVERAGLDLRFEIVKGGAPGTEGGGEAPGVGVNFEGRDTELLLEHNGELLLALEHLMMRSLRVDPRAHELVRFDAGDFRGTRLAELKLSAQVAAQRVRELRQPFRMGAMSARERRVVHLTLANEKGVRTASEGEGERRRVVIYPTEKPERR
ncbi:MAG TPA: R3H domain-containing nucleic acid-binding protein [Candidatus Acidoferrales bacterium]|nr:R3H domain-containing nucleic acid-binding protein [Candidatus Acidoferrales bacterium]